MATLQRKDMIAKHQFALHLQVPVGGTVVAAPAERPHLLRAMAARYPGRAAATAHLDVAITLLHWGRAGWARELRAREALFPYLRVRHCPVLATLPRRAQAAGKGIAGYEPAAPALCLTTYGAFSQSLAPGCKARD